MSGGELARIWAELRESGMDPLLTKLSQVLLLRTRIERVVERIPREHVASGGKSNVPVRLWAVAVAAEPERRAEALTVVRATRRIYRQTSDFLHARSASVAPSDAELAAWHETLTALEALLPESGP
ncbi:hypothetical protein [Saccharopolyspora gloriosae]|uniref:hypothetical protein n=1 Tax=Saccharopolyspora gloriosae TaxID=455344 RepID=UPI001FB5D8C1|nr:hypothetical protein [Saccharopolyspora gloriosae]